ncbi:MAG: proline dehydrogenase [Candidatus Kapaibacteriales bacterium]
MPLLPKRLVKVFASKYIAGELITDAISTAKKIGSLGGTTTIDVLGEFVESRGQALKETAMQKMVVDAIVNEGLATYLSVKPTSVGMGIDRDFGYENILEIVDYAHNMGVFVRLDMENSPYTSLTLEYYKRLRDIGYENIGFVIQAYLKRSMDDIIELAEYKPNTRLCKGIYVERAEIAYKNPDEIRNNYTALLDKMIELGYFVGIATHDQTLIDYAEKKIAEENLTKDQYEFQMLLGVRESARNALLQNHNVRIYVPFGLDWYGYSIRRFNENPEMAKTIALSFLKPWKN